MLERKLPTVSRRVISRIFPPFLLSCFVFCSALFAGRPVCAAAHGHQEALQLAAHAAARRLPLRGEIKPTKTSRICEPRCACLALRRGATHVRKKNTHAHTHGGCRATKPVLPRQYHSFLFHQHSHIWDVRQTSNRIALHLLFFSNCYICTSIAFMHCCWEPVGVGFPLLCFCQLDYTTHSSSLESKAKSHYGSQQAVYNYTETQSANCRSGRV